MSVLLPVDRWRVGVVTVLYQSDDVLGPFMRCLAAQHGPSLHVYVIDNSPTDRGSVLAQQLANEHGLRATVVFNNANAGVARGNNQGIERALRDGCTHVLLANNDTEFEPSTIDTLCRALHDHKEAACTAKLYYHGTAKQIWYAGGSIDEWRALIPHHGMRDVDRGQFDQQTHTGYAPTCFMLFDARVFQSVGMMDERYFVYFDDADFILRFNRLGGRIRFVPSAVVDHKVSTSTGGERSPFTLYWTARNRLYFVRKNFKGLRKWFALSYIALTRLPRWWQLTPAQRERMQAGLRDGWRMRIDPSSERSVGLEGHSSSPS